MPIVRSNAPATDAAFWLASVTAFLLALLSLGTFDALLRFESGATNVFLVSQAMRVPGPEGDRLHRIGWTPSRIAELAERLGAPTRLSPISIRAGVLEGSDRTLAVSVVTISRAVAAALSDRTPLVCDGATLHASPRTLETFGSNTVRLGGQSYIAIPARLEWLQAFARSTHDAMVLRCLASDVPSREGAGWLVATGDGTLSARLQHARQSSARDSQSAFATELRFEPLADALRQSAARELGWIPPVLAALVVMGLMLNLAWAGLASFNERAEDRIRWLLGGPPLRIALGAGIKTCIPVAASGVLAAVLCAALVAGGAVQPPDAPVLTLGGYAVLVAGTALASAALRAGASWWALRAPGGTSGGARITTPIWPYLLAWAVGLYLAMLVSALAASVIWFTQRLDRIDPGFQADGLYAVSVRRAGAADGTADDIVQRARAGLADAFGVTAVEAACVPPWRFSGFSFLDEDDGSTGLVMPVTAGFLQLIGARMAHGSPFPPGSDRDSHLALIQVQRSEEREQWRRVYSVLGETQGLRVGAYAPSLRSILFRPMAALDCEDVELVFRHPGWSLPERIRGMAELRQRMPALAWSDPTSVLQVYRQARSGVRQLSRLLVAVSAVGLMLMFALSGTLVVALAAAQRRETAVRMALGASYGRIASGVMLRSLAWCVPAVLAAAASLFAAHGLMKAFLLDWLPPPAGLLCVTVALVCLSGALFLWLSTVRALGRVDLQAELAG